MRADRQTDNKIITRGSQYFAVLPGQSNDRQARLDFLFAFSIVGLTVALSRFVSEISTM